MGRVRAGGAERWKSRAAAASQTYVDGVNNPRRDWAEATAAAEANYAQGIQSAVSKKSFSKGVKRVGSEKQKRGVTEKGATRFAQGVQLGDANYQTGIAPYIQELESKTLPPRGPKGSPANLERVRAVNDALFKKKQQIKG